MSLPIACALVLIALPGLALGAEETRLVVEPGRWQEKLFLPEGSRMDPADAARFAIEEDEKRGPALAVGPWRAGQWSARFQYGESLPAVAGTLKGQYRTEGLRPGQAEVSVDFHKGGERVTRRSFRLDPAEEWTPFDIVMRYVPAGCETFSPGFGLGQQTEGRVLFAGLSFEPGVPPIEFPDELPDVTRPAPPERLAEGAFFRLAETDGAWWLVRPDGQPFYSRAPVGPSFPRGDEGMPEGRAHAALLRENGFNSLAGWTNVWRWAHLNDALLAEGAEPVPIFFALQTGGYGERCDQLVDAAGQHSGEGHAFPDPFDPRFAEAYARSVRGIIDMVRGKPWFAGWFADNEVSHRQLYRRVWSEHCSAAFREWLAGQYGNIGALNAAWATDFASFDDLVARRPDPVPNTGRMHEDALRFERVIVQRYIDVTLRVVREHDPDHLIFSNRFMLGDSGDWPRVLDLYAAYDGVAVNVYPANQSPGLSDRAKDILRMVHERTGKPMIIGEWSVPAIDSGLYDHPEKLDWSWPQVVATQEERARQAAIVTIDFYNLPFLVGAHWFHWRDFNSPERCANRGLFTSDGQPYTELLGALTRAHAALAQHEGDG